MSRFLKILSYASNILIWVLMLAILVVVVISAIIILPGLRELWNHTYGSAKFANAVDSEELKYLSSFVLSSAALVALLTYMREKKRIGREREERRSHFFHKQAVAGLEEIHKLLKDQNNDRII